MSNPYRDTSFAPSEHKTPPRVGVLVRFWRWLFVDEERCASFDHAAILFQRCVGRADPRCRGGNCTAHCKDHCDGRCSK